MYDLFRMNDTSILHLLSMCDLFPLQRERSQTYSQPCMQSGKTMKEGPAQVESSLKALLQDILAIILGDKVGDGDAFTFVSKSATTICL